MLVIGIDPDTKKHGVAWLSDGQIIKLASMNTDDLVADLVSISAKGIPLVIKLEDVNVNKPVYPRPGQSRLQMLKIAQNVGAVKYAATTLLERINHTTLLKVNLVNPLPKALSGKRYNQAVFNKVTGWTGKSNGDTRDAAMIALHGRAAYGQQLIVSGG